MKPNCRERETPERLRLYRSERSAVTSMWSRAWARLVVVLFGSAAVHLALLWLWNPFVEVGPPQRQAAGERRAGASDVVVVFAGDTAPTDAATDTLSRFGFEYPYASTLRLLRDSDLTVVNLETAVSTDAPAFPLYKRYLYRTNPLALDAMKWAGIDAVTLANNHIMDHGPQGLRDTLRHLRQRSIAAIGAGETAADARRGVVFDVRGTRIGILSYLEDSPMHSLYMRSFAWGPHRGCARLEASFVKQDVARLRRHADVVVVSMHWGRYYEGVTLMQRLYGRIATEAGADAVIGHHPHVPHPVGVHHGRPIIYSLGNYAFGTRGRSHFRHGLVVRLHLRKGGIRRVELVPLLVQNRLVHFRPEPLLAHEARRMLEGLAIASREHGADLRIVGDRAVLDL